MEEVVHILNAFLIYGPEPNQEVADALQLNLRETESLLYTFVPVDEPIEIEYQEIEEYLTEVTLFPAGTMLRIEGPYIRYQALLNLIQLFTASDDTIGPVEFDEEYPNRLILTSHGYN